MSEIQTIPIHFNTKDHHLSLETFIKTSKGVERVVDGISEKIFKKKPEIKILVLPPREGTFLEVIGLFIGGLWAFTESEFGKTFIKELSGRSTAEWGKDAAVALKEITKSFLERDTGNLRKIGIQIKDFPKAFSGRSDFYRACMEDSEVKGLEFSKNGVFSIKNSDFVQYIEKDHKEKLPTEHKFHKLAIVAPVTKKRKKSKLKWQAEDVKNKNLLKFLMKDEDFKAKVFTGGEYLLRENKEEDVIIGLFEYEKVEINGEIKVVGPVLAKKIYQFNDKEILPLPENYEIQPVEKFEMTNGSKVAKNEKVIFDNETPSLFSELNTESK